MEAKHDRECARILNVSTADTVFHSRADRKYYIDVSGKKSRCVDLDAPAVSPSSCHPVTMDLG